MARRDQIVAFQSEAVINGDTIDADVVETDVLAAGRDFRALLISLRDARIESDVVLDVAADRGQLVDRVAGHQRAGPGLVGAEYLGANAGNRLHGFQRGHVVVERNVNFRHPVEVEVHPIAAIGASTSLVDGDRVRTTDAQAAGVVTAFGIGDRAADRARFGVGDGDFRICHRLAISADNTATNTGGRALGERGSGCKDGEQAKGEFGDADAVVMGHYVGLGALCALREKVDVGSANPSSECV